jgi:perosamine synthetase
MTHTFPMSIPDLSGNEQRYATEAVASGWISSMGEFLQRFEGEFAEACNCDYALGTSSGTTALHLAVAALGLGPGDEVILPSLTYIATANAVTYCGATPVFVDVDPITWCLDPTKIEEAITPRTKGIIPVHLLGHPADMDPIVNLAVTHGLWVVEDAAEAIFATYKGRLCGSLGNAAAFSFFGNKVLTSGEGGAVTLNDPLLQRRMAMLRGQGMDPNRRYHFPIVGFNYRMTNVAAAILCGQMERRHAIITRRQEIVSLYSRQLSKIPGITVREIAPWATASPWLASCLVEPTLFGCNRDQLAVRLKAAGIDSRPLFEPLHQLPPYRQEAQHRGTALPVTDRLAGAGIMLPTYPQLTDEQVRFICASIRVLADGPSRHEAARIDRGQPAVISRRAA